MSAQKTVGLIGARGHVGKELLALLAAHEGFEVTAVSSRALKGEPVSAHVPGFPGDLTFEDIAPDALPGRNLDVVVLALPNGAAAPFVAALEASAPDTIIIDLSADYRFDCGVEGGWVYGLPEMNRTAIKSTHRIANPGCYATAMLLALLPVRDLLAGPPSCFGVSGYSGAGTTPSRKNDTEALKDNLMPYALSGHLHEQEVSRHLEAPVHFMPHVAEFFRGISMTIDAPLKGGFDESEIMERFTAKYRNEPLVQIVDTTPEVRDGQGSHGCRIGGFNLSHLGVGQGKRLVMVSVLDNLLKGAATQALQNMNLAAGFGEFDGIPRDKT